MNKCKHCGSLLSVHGPACPSCGREDQQTEVSNSPNAEVELQDSLGQKMVAVARFSNAAEAGYFAAELQHAEQIETKLSEDSQFDAVTGGWRQNYLLFVAEDHSELASQFLYHTESETDEPNYVQEEFPDVHVSPAVGVNWVPIILTTLAAGSVAYWGIKRVEQQPAPPVLKNDLGLHKDDLWKTLSTSDSPWVQHLNVDGGLRLLHVGRDGSAVIQEDRDGDGHFERKQHFHR